MEGFQFSADSKSSLNRNTLHLEQMMQQKCNSSHWVQSMKIQEQLPYSRIQHQLAAEVSLHGQTHPAVYMRCPYPNPKEVSSESPCKALATQGRSLQSLQIYY